MDPVRTEPSARAELDAALADAAAPEAPGQAVDAAGGDAARASVRPAGAADPGTSVRPAAAADPGTSVTPAGAADPGPDPAPAAPITSPAQGTRRRRVPASDPAAGPALPAGLVRTRRKGAPSRVIARVFEADLSAPVVAAGTRIQNVRQISERVAMGRALWRELVVGFASQLGELNLGFTQLAALYVLAEGATTTVADLAESIGRSPSATSRLVDGLVRRRLVERRREEDDRRQRSVWLTAARACGAADRGPVARGAVPDGRSTAAPRRAGADRDGGGRAGDARDQPARAAGARGPSELAGPADRAGRRASSRPSAGRRSASGRPPVPARVSHRGGRWRSRQRRRFHWTSIA